MKLVDIGVIFINIQDNTFHFLVPDFLDPDLVGPCFNASSVDKVLI